MFGCNLVGSLLRGTAHSISCWFGEVILFSSDKGSWFDSQDGQQNSRKNQFSAFPVFVDVVTLKLRASAEQGRYGNHRRKTSYIQNTSSYYHIFPNNCFRGYLAIHFARIKGYHSETGSRGTLTINPLLQASTILDKAGDRRCRANFDRHNYF